MTTLRQPKGQLYKTLSAKRRPRRSVHSRKVLDEHVEIVWAGDTTPDTVRPGAREKSIWFLVFGSLSLTALVVLALNTNALTRWVQSIRSTETPTPKSEASIPPSSDPLLPLFERSLNGGRVDSEALVNPKLVAVSIDNMLEGRPASGIDQALWVFEFPAEATITRFLGIFDVGQTVSEIGPVRSVRPYMLDLAQSLGAALVHSGGSPDALKILSLKNAPVRSINEFSWATYFWRDRDRPGPHNLYTTTERLRLHPAVTAVSAPTLSPLKWQRNAPVSTGHQKLTIFFPEPYTARWQYDGITQQLQRVDVKENPERTRSGASVTADSVVVQFTDIKILDAAGRYRIRTLGEGEAMVVTRGTMELARWIRKSPSDRTTLVNVLGEPLSITPGKIWWTIVPKATPVSFE